MSLDRFSKLLAALGLLALSACCAPPRASLLGNSQEPYPPAHPPKVGQILHLPTGTYVSLPQMQHVATDSQVVYVGETHDNPASHRLELEVLKALAERYPGEAALGMEMFSDDQQPLVDHFDAHPEFLEPEMRRNEILRLLEGGLIEQNILDLPEDQRPELINDRGRQMKAKPIKRLCEDHALPQLFARPRTPNDNPFIESAFSTVKRAPEYPDRFLDDSQAVAYFGRYFTWYDTEHYHSGIDYVTPQQAHDGLRPIIVEQRRVKKLAQRRRRREENQKQKTGPQETKKHITMSADLVV